MENIGELCRHKADKSKATAGGCNKCVGMPKPAHMLTFTLNVILVTAKWSLKTIRRVNVLQCIALFKKIIGFSDAPLHECSLDECHFVFS